MDSSYCGEVKGQFFTIHGIRQINKGDKIMQMEIVSVKDIEFEQVQELSKTDRGEKGFGSTGK